MMLAMTVTTVATPGERAFVRWRRASAMIEAQIKSVGDRKSVRYRSRKAERQAREEGGGRGSGGEGGEGGGGGGGDDGDDHDASAGGLFHNNNTSKKGEWRSCIT